MKIQKANSKNRLAVKFHLIVSDKLHSPIVAKVDGSLLPTFTSKENNSQFHKNMTLLAYSDRAIELDNLYINLTTGEINKANQGLARITPQPKNLKRIEVSTDPDHELNYFNPQFLVKYITRWNDSLVNTNDKIEAGYLGISLKDKDALYLNNNNLVCVIPSKINWNREEVSTVIKTILDDLSINYNMNSIRDYYFQDYL